MGVGINLDGHDVGIFCVRKLHTELPVQLLLARPVGVPYGGGEIPESRKEYPQLGFRPALPGLPRVDDGLRGGALGGDLPGPSGNGDGVAARVEDGLVAGEPAVAFGDLRAGLGHLGVGRRMQLHLRVP
ncbi:hypothetical protein [Yinghuangia soli]|uniref:Uncharacterized protein n=1 Tax=Yinghuangia soli TaxID=2908204 RepID=A0AA41U575_9ACTN|nr:hypothetical protein [Yinghuangia soli]MCF2529709.1 hypothetical protein [Yinghuangia soli]